MKLKEMRTRSDDDCLSDLQLDSLALGTLDGVRAEQAERHVSSCDRCSARRQGLAEATRSSADILEHSPSKGRAVKARWAKEAGQVARRPERRAWLGRGVAAAVAAAALLLLLQGLPKLTSDTVRTKGNGSVGFFVRHAGVVRRGNDGERVAPGDALRFVVTSSVPVHVAVLSRDGAGQVSVYYPNGPRAARTEPGVERPLDASVVLDDVLGEERLFALSCSAPIEVAPVSDGLRRTDTEPAWPSECAVERFRLIKEKAKP